MKRLLIVILLTLLPFKVALRAELPDTLWYHSIQRIDTTACFVLKPDKDRSTGGYSYPIRITLPAGREYRCRAETTWTWEPIATKDIIVEALSGNDAVPYSYIVCDTVEVDDQAYASDPALAVYIITCDTVKCFFYR